MEFALIDTSSKHAASYLADAVSTIDAQFGPDYAKKNPALVGVFMHVAVLEYQASEVGSIAEALEALTKVAK